MVDTKVYQCVEDLNRNQKVLINIGPETLSFGDRDVGMFVETHHSDLISPEKIGGAMKNRVELCSRVQHKLRKKMFHAECPKGDSARGLNFAPCLTLSCFEMRVETLLSFHSTYPYFFLYGRQKMLTKMNHVARHLPRGFRRAIFAARHF